MKDLSGERVMFACAKCGTPRSERIARLSAGTVLHCAKCGAAFDVEALLREPTDPCACRDAGPCAGQPCGPCGLAADGTRKAAVPVRKRTTG